MDNFPIKLEINTLEISRDNNNECTCYYAYDNDSNKYGYEKYKKRNYKECIKDLLCNFIFIGLIEIPFLFFTSKIGFVKWVMGIGTALLIILTILYIIHYEKKSKIIRIMLMNTGLM